MVSKALARSKNMADTKFLLASDLEISSKESIRANLVEYFFLNPN